MSSSSSACFSFFFSKTLKGQRLLDVIWEIDIQIHSILSTIHKNVPLTKILLSAILPMCWEMIPTCISNLDEAYRDRGNYNIIFVIITITSLHLHNFSPTLTTGTYKAYLHFLLTSVEISTTFSDRSTQLFSTFPLSPIQTPIDKTTSVNLSSMMHLNDLGSICLQITAQKLSAG